MIHVTPHQLLGRIKTDTRAGWILRRLCAYHPDPVSQESLMDGAGIRPNIEGRLRASVSFYWSILRINDDLAGFGLQVNQTPGGLWKIGRVG